MTRANINNAKRVLNILVSCWKQTSSVLGLGEVGVSDEIGKITIGGGGTVWNLLKRDGIKKRGGEIKSLRTGACYMGALKERGLLTSLQTMFILYYKEHIRPRTLYVLYILWDISLSTLKTRLMCCKFNFHSIHSKTIIQPFLANEETFP